MVGVMVCPTMGCEPAAGHRVRRALPGPATAVRSRCCQVTGRGHRADGRPGRDRSCAMLATDLCKKEIRKSGRTAQPPQNNSTAQDP